MAVRQSGGMRGIRFNFPGFARLRPITWEEWFDNFERHQLTFVYESQPDDAQLSQHLEVQGVRVLDEQRDRPVLRPPSLERARPVSPQRCLLPLVDGSRPELPAADVPTGLGTFTDRPLPLLLRRCCLTKSPRSIAAASPGGVLNARNRSSGFASARARTMAIKATSTPAQLTRGGGAILLRRRARDP